MPTRQMMSRCCARALVVASLTASNCFAFPSFRDRVPNGRRVPCPGGVDGGEDGESLDCQPKQVCNGLGHATCAGGSMPLNPFGEALREANFEWAQSLCQADSDGDGLTNGQELGDPCCLWHASDVPSRYTQTFAPTHPGFKTDAAVVRAYSQPDCALASPEKKGVALGEFAPGEDRHMVEMRFNKFEIPELTTTYVYIALNFPESMFNESFEAVFHVVSGEAIVDQKQYLHHFVVLGCSKRFSTKQNGKVVSVQQAKHCKEPFGGWAPGLRIVAMPPWAGKPFGPGSKMLALLVQVHYNNPNNVGGLVDSSGVRLWYTSTLREYHVAEFDTQRVVRNPTMLVPAGKKRWFLTRRCEVDITNKFTKTPMELPIFGVAYHAHLLGREMYTEIIRPGELPLSLGSERRWHFDDQRMRNVLNANFSLRTGDVVQVTCVMDSSSRTKATVMGLQTTDEMCWQRFYGWHKDAKSMKMGCKGYAWSGELSDADSVFGIADHHPYSHAPVVWDGSTSSSGGQIIFKNGNKQFSCIDVSRMCQRITDKVSCDRKVGGTSVVVACCATLCMASKGMCKNTEQCKDVLALATAGGELATVAEPSWAPTYKLQVSSCNGLDKHLMTFEVDMPALPSSTASITSPLDSTRTTGIAMASMAIRMPFLNTMAALSLLATW